MAARSLSISFLAAMMMASLLQISSAQTTYMVGDSLGWTVPPAGAVAYSTWAANKTFAAGDILVFNFTTGRHDVAQVTKADYDNCNTTTPILLVATGPARIILNSSGEHYFICNFTSHCSLGQKLMINVSEAAFPSPPPSPSPSPSLSPSPAPSPQSVSPTPASSPETSPSPAPSRAPVTYTVGDALNWTVPPAGAVAYQNWAANKTFVVGDSLVFNYRSGQHDVAQVTSANYESCGTSNPISLNTTAPTIITLTSSGPHYYICTIPSHCSLGQKLAINVTGSSTATPPSSTATPPGTSANPPSSGSTPSTPDNGATSLGAAGLSATVMAIFVAVMF